jgi:hypothetical protein
VAARHTGDADYIVRVEQTLIVIRNVDRNSYAVVIEGQLTKVGIDALDGSIVDVYT